MTRKAVFVIFAALTAALFRCDYVDMVAVTKADFTPPADTNTKYQQSKRYFLLHPGDTALLYGTAACTLVTNGRTVSATADSVFFRTITRPEERLSINDTAYVVTPQVFQTSGRLASLDSAGITRYFRQTASGVQQLAFEENGIMTFVPKANRVVVPNPLDMGSFGTINSPLNNWMTFPLFSWPLPGFKGARIFEARSVATLAIALNTLLPPYWVRGFYYFDGVEIVTYHALNGTGTMDGRDAAVIGTIEVKSNYFKDKGLADQFQHWHIQVNYENGRTDVIKKDIWVGRGPGGARTYADYDTNKVERGIDLAPDKLPTIASDR
jgi:hypothetical protein